MLTMMMRTLATVCAVVACGCSPQPASAPDAWFFDAAAQQDLTAGDGSSTPVLDFAIQGCEQRTASRCIGSVPLKLTFALVSSEAGLVGSWDMGDGSDPIDSSTVSHVYGKPGLYTVTLTVSRGGGTLGEQKRDVVLVKPSAPGGSCSDDQACGGDTCVCLGSECGPPLSDGFCLRGCKPGQCPNGTVCADLSRGVEDDAEPWRTEACFPSCEKDNECKRAGFTCRLAPTGTGWRRICMPPWPYFIGASCRNAVGEPNDALCLGGMCLDVGAAGYCSAPCDAESCPDGTECARFTAVDVVPDSQAVCLRRCDEGICDEDPLLGCEASNAAGDFGFVLLGSPDQPDAAYCSVRRCEVGQDQCGIGGICSAARGGFCQPES